MCNFVIIRIEMVNIVIKREIKIKKSVKNEEKNEESDECRQSRIDGDFECAAVLTATRPQHSMLENIQ